MEDLINMLNENYTQLLSSCGESQNNQAILIRDGLQVNAALTKRIKELEAKIKGTLEQEPVCHVSGFDRVWWNDKFTSPDEVPKRNTPLYTEAKPAKELYAELIEWVRMQRNDIPTTGEEFANAIEVWLEDKMK
jgi:hypothetical protein